MIFFMYCIKFRTRSIIIMKKDFSLQELACPGQTLLWPIGFSLPEITFYTYLAINIECFL